MESKDPILVIENGIYDQRLIKQFQEDAHGKKLLIFVGGRDKALKGFLFCPDSSEELSHMIEALKSYQNEKNG